jgi:hypothetical protein
VSQQHPTWHPSHWRTSRQWHPARLQTAQAWHPRQRPVAARDWHGPSVSPPLGGGGLMCPASELPALTFAVAGHSGCHPLWRARGALPASWSSPATHLWASVRQLLVALRQRWYLRRLAAAGVADNAHQLPSIYIKEQGVLWLRHKTGLRDGRRRLDGERQIQVGTGVTSCNDENSVPQKVFFGSGFQRGKTGR